MSNKPYAGENTIQALIDKSKASFASIDHGHDDIYETKTDASAKLTEAKEYTDTKTSSLASTTVVDNKISTHNTSTSAHSDIRALITDLTTKLNNFLDVDDTTTDQLSEVLTLIENNKGTLESLTSSKINVSDIVDNLTTSSATKVLSAKQGVAIKALIDALQTELDGHTHAIADVSGLQSALDAKAASSHGTHVTYSTTAPVMDGTASVGTASTVARSDHKHPTDTSRAAASDLTSHTGNTSNPHKVTKAQVGLGNVDNTADADKNVKSAVEDADGQVISETYIKGLSVSGKVITYTRGDDTTGTITTQDTNTTYTSLKNPYALTIQGNGTTLTNGTYDGSAAKTVNITPASIGAAATSHTHSNYAASSHTHDDRYYTESEIDAKLDAIIGEGAAETLDTIGEISAAITENQDMLDTLNSAIGNKVNSSDLSSHTGNTTVHITSTERTNWNAAKTHADSAHAPSNAEANQNAFSNITVGSTTIAADTETDTLTLVGSNVTLTPDATNDKVTIGITKANVTAALGYTPPTTNTTYSVATSSTAGLVKSGTDITVDSSGNVSVNDNSHKHTVSNISDLTATAAELNKMDGVTATTAEINYLDGVTSSIQSQLDSKAASSHTHSYAGSSSAGGAATSANKLNTNAGSATQPVYFSNGVPVKTTYTLGKSVPSDAVFTDTNTHYTSKNVVASSATAISDATSTLNDGEVYLNSVENNQVTSSHLIVGANGLGVTTGDNGEIVVKHPYNPLDYTDSGLYKVKVDSYGHVIELSEVEKSDITALGIPSTNTTYSAAGSSLGLVKSGGDVTISSGVITVNDNSHAHTIANIDGLQDALDGKAASSHGTHVSYGTSATAIGSTASAGSATTVSRSDHTHSLSKSAVTTALGYTPPTTNTTYSQATSSALGLVKIGYTESGKNYPVELNDSGQMYVNVPWTDNNTVYTHPSYTARTGKPTANQTPAFGGTATVSQITSDATGHVTGATDRTITIPATLSNGTGTAGLIKTSSTVTSNSGYTACPVISGVPYYKDTNTTYSLSSFGVTATAAELNALDGITATVTELNYCDGVTSNIQTQLDAKAASSHSHATSDITSGTLGVARGGTGRASLTSGYFLRGNGTSAVTQTAPASVRSAIGVTEGTWTPSVHCGGSPTTVATGRYLKSGNLVIIHFYVNITGTMSGSATSQLYLSGLPYTPDFSDGSTWYGGGGVFQGGTPIVEGTFSGYNIVDGGKIYPRASYVDSNGISNQNYYNRKPASDANIHMAGTIMYYTAS